MAQRRNQVSVRRVVVPPIFDIPEGLEGLVYDDDYEDIDEQGELEDFIESNDKDKTKKKKKKKKKKRKKRKKNKGKKKKNKKKDRDKKKDKKDKKEDSGKGGRKLNTPSSLEIVKQVIRTKRDGSQVVDLTVDVDRINRADKYEFRITKKDTGKTTVIEA